MRKRNHAVTIRMNDVEYQMLCDKVRASGQTQQSVILDAVREVPIVPKEQLQELIRTNQEFAKQNQQLRGMATNVNQMAHRANAQGVLPTFRELVSMHESISEWKKECDGIWQSIRRLISRQSPTEP